VNYPVCLQADTKHCNNLLNNDNLHIYITLAEKNIKQMKTECTIPFTTAAEIQYSLLWDAFSYVNFIA